jgi:integrase
MPTQKLRQDTVRTLPYVGPGGKHQCIYWDEVLECFGLRVYSSGRRIYVCSYRVNRRKRLARLGRVDALTLDQARKKATAYLGKVASNEDPQDVTDQLRTAQTVKQLIEAYIENHAKPKKRSWKNDKSCLERLLLPKFGARLAVTVTSAEIQEIHAQKGAVHPRQANRFVEIVRKMFNWAPTAGLLPKGHDNPGVGIVPFPTRKRKRFITTVEMPRFVEALEQESSESGRHGIWLLLFTGLRTTELLKAKWADIDWEMGTLFIGLTKNGDPLLAPLSDAAVARLQMIPRIAGNPYIICGKNPGDHFKDLGPVLKRVLTGAGLENITIHDLRRTVGSWLAQAGQTLHLIGDVLNHRDPKTTAGYAYFQTQQRRDALSVHANKVLSYAAPGVRAAAAPKSLSAENLLPREHARENGFGESHPGRHRHYFNREALYELVWTAPVSEIAKKLGVSDVGLAKLCRRAAIPLPGRGYWARVESGQQIAAEPLPPAPSGLPELLRIRGTNATSNNEEAATAAAISSGTPPTPATV